MPKMPRFESLTFRKLVKVMSYNVAEYVVGWLFVSYKTVKKWRNSKLSPVRDAPEQATFNVNLRISSVIILGKYNEHVNYYYNYYNYYNNNNNNYYYCYFNYYFNYYLIQTNFNKHVEY